MKKIFFITTAVLLSAAAISQNKNNVPGAIAYSREILKGVNPTGIPDEKGGYKKNPSGNTVQYLIYLEEKNGIILKNVIVWINNKKYTTTAAKITTPLITDNLTLKGNKPDTLVSVSKNTVWQLQLKKEVTDLSKNADINKLLHKNAMVIEYNGKGKRKIVAVKEIKKLSPLPLQ